MTFTQCKGFTRKGLPCSSNVMKGSEFCGSHDKDHLEKFYCSVILKSGRQCHGGAIHGTRLCLIHTPHAVGVAKVSSESGVLDLAYREYLASAKWRLRRERRLEMDNYACVLCGSTQSLECHHVSYARLGWESMSDLRTLCRGCHASVTADEKSVGREKANERFATPRSRRIRKAKQTAR